MSIIKLIIADENQNYAKALALYFQEEYAQSFDITCLTQNTVLQEYLNKFETADILLIDQKMFKDSLPCKHIKSVIVLDESINENANNSSIYKYQKADVLAKYLFEIYEKSSGSRGALNKSDSKCKVISVYSPAGAVGKTTIAYNIARQYGMQYQKALFISLETYASLEVFKQSEAVQGLMYLLYLIKNKAQNLQHKLNTIKVVEINTNVHFIERESNVLEYKDLKIDDIDLLVNFLRNQSGYDAIIFDLDSSINEAILGVLKHSDVILNIRCNDTFDKVKQEDFKRQIPRINNLLEVDINRKIIKVNNKSQNLTNSDNKALENSMSTIEIPYINSEITSHGAYFAEMPYFKQLYDAVENFLGNKGSINDGYKR
jgi:cellulose biosynthesis protein BcsQ